MGATGAVKRKRDSGSAPWSVVGLTVVFVVVAQVQFSIAVAEAVWWPAVVGVLLLVAAVVLAKPPSHVPWPVRCASRLLPADVRHEQLEEWANWMLVLREQGMPRIQRWIELLTIILIAAPELAILLRKSANKAEKT